jgi:hypothetical protein
MLERSFLAPLQAAYKTSFLVHADCCIYRPDRADNTVPGSGDSALARNFWIQWRLTHFFLMQLVKAAGTRYKRLLVG